MYVVELAVEGLSSLPDKARLGFRGHLDVVRLDSREARSALVDVLFHTLFPDPGRADATRGLVSADAARRRSVLTLSGRDRVPYRMMRDLASGSARLYRFDRAAGSHELLSESAREAQQFLRVQYQLPDDQSYERLFLFTAEGRPSLGARAKSRTGVPVVPGAPAPSGPGLPRRGAQAGAEPLFGSSSPSSTGDLPRDLTGAFPLPSVLGEATGTHALPSGFSMHNALVKEELELSGTVDMAPESSDDELRERYRSLLAERENAKRRARAESTLDALAEKEEKAREALDALAVTEDRRVRVEARLRAEPALLDLPSDFADRLERYETATARHSTEQGRLGGELEALREAEARHRSRPWVREPLVTGGAFGGVVSAAAAVASGLPWLVLGQIAGGAVAGFGVLRRLERQTQALERAERLVGLEERAAKSERLHRLDTSTVRGLLERAGESEPSHLADRLREVQKLQAELREIEAALEGELGRRGRKAREIITKIQDRKADCEQTLARYSETRGSEASVGRRLQSLRAELRARGVDPNVIEPRRGSEVSVVLGTADLPGSPAPLELPDDDDDDDDDDGSGGYEPGSGGLGASAGRGWLCASGSFIGGGAASSGIYGGGGGGGPASRPAILAEVAADLAGQDLESFVDGVRDRVRRFVRVLSSGVFTNVRLGARGDLELESTDGSVSYDALEGEQLDQVDAALRFALLESVLRVRRAPVLIEEPVAAMPPHRREVLRRIYAHLAQMTQVIVFTPADDLEGHQVL